MGAFFQELLRAGIYKRSQGRITRQVTFAGCALLIVAGVLSLSATLAGKGHVYQFAIPGLVLAVCLWVSYRVVNLPAFADFLIAVEAEMNKVSWPTRPELFRSSSVVLVFIFMLAATLAIYDVVWQAFFTYVLGIR